MVDKVDIGKIKTGQFVEVDADKGEINVEE